MRCTTAAAAAVDPALLSSAASISAGRELKISVKSSPAVKFAAKRLTVSCAAASSPSQLGRRALMYMAATSFLVPFPNPSFATDEASLLQEEIRKVLTKTKAPGFLRLVFHDAGTFDEGDKTGGMNGSIVYELERPENAGLQKTLKILEKVKDQMESVRPVSWADLIAMAGAEAVLICGGPDIPVRLGRVDATVPDPTGKLPEETLDAKAMKQSFQKKGFSAQELVALSGAHTLGTKGFGSPVVFDNSYYKILVKKPWSSSGGMSSMIGLPSDKALADDDECNRWISKYAEDQSLFFEDFKKAYTKLVNTGAKWSSA
ncbi:putative L-ascorbate peroxidase 6 [Salvia miltiorrhiza]|uniref:putative L-ascorbate peroxidase 6 n=1 Tax=Salvia miltiorrhiza TaxID=226208 RepID=UPI0025AC7368|nr:putative L-ascorbate peroxidase 6 [Salvia miltiorrhiza]